jgi:hypothetical protein
VALNQWFTASGATTATGSASGSDGPAARRQGPRRGACGAMQPAETECGHTVTTVRRVYAPGAAPAARLRRLHCARGTLGPGRPPYPQVAGAAVVGFCGRSLSKPPASEKAQADPGVPPRGEGEEVRSLHEMQQAAGRVRAFATQTRG